MASGPSKHASMFRKSLTKARSFQVTKGKRSGKKNGVQRGWRSVYSIGSETRRRTPLGNKEPNGSGHYPLIWFSGEIIWPLGQISLLVKIGDEEHSTSAWMNFVIVRSSSPYNGIIGRLGIRKIQPVPSTTHRMLKFPVTGGILTLRSSKIVPIECAAISKVEGQLLAINQAMEERIKVAIHPEYPK
ncbi:hypothetical protein Tco_1467375 [Tanacetum coccineum]